MSTAPPPSPAPRTARFRGDVEGLRALAVVLVLLHHAGLRQPSGGFVGVDLFFVVSGFVITSGLVREVERTGHLSLSGFYARRAKRLLPAAGLVLLTTAVLAWAFAPSLQLGVISTDIVGAAAYVVNWVFSGRSVDYLAEDVDPSPVLHFWSLAVEEQFYVVWPLVILALLWLLRRRAAAGHETSVRRHLAIGLAAVIVVPSLVFSLVWTQLHPAQAFFITPTRLWELGLGALVALGSGLWAALTKRAAVALGVVGLLMILVSSVSVSTATAWPGVAALLPTLGTAAVIVAGFASGGSGVDRLLALKPLVWIGGLSYSLYLWHWTVLTAAGWIWGPLGTRAGLLAVTLSVLPAWLSYRLVESPMRYSQALTTSPRFALSMGANFTLVALAAGLVLGSTASTPSAAEAGRPTGAGLVTDASGTDGTDAEPGGTGGTPGDEPLPLPKAEQPGDEPLFTALTPPPAAATQDVPALYAQGCHSEQDDPEVHVCDLGDPNGDLVVAVAGDSKIAQWVPALDIIAKEQGWVLRVYTKSACSFNASDMFDGDDVLYPTCMQWNDAVLERLLGDERPDVLITSSVRNSSVPPDSPAGTERTHEAMVDGYVDYWQQLAEKSVKIVVISNSPSPPDALVPVYQCVAEHPDDRAACSWPLKTSSASEVLKKAVDKVPEASYIDMDPWVCPGKTCVGVYRNVVTYRQGSHLTSTFVTLLAEPLAGYLVPMVEKAR